jgi:hypothetical protein
MVMILTGVPVAGPEFPDVVVEPDEVVAVFAAAVVVVDGAAVVAGVVVVDEVFLEEPHAATVAAINRKPTAAETLSRFTGLSLRCVEPGGSAVNTCCPLPRGGRSDCARRLSHTVPMAVKTCHSS